jgi:dienelactone hydrolase
LEEPSPAPVREVRRMSVEGMVIRALVMRSPDGLELPAYLVEPAVASAPERVVMAIHGHGQVEPCLGSGDDYHHGFALALARDGHRVLCPELRGFGVLARPGMGRAGDTLAYWWWGERILSFSLASDGCQRGRPLIGATVTDLRRWEAWLAGTGVTEIDAVGISYGGDLALLYPVYSALVRRIFASGTLGSYSAIYAQGNNAPAHAIPGVMAWFDRADIAGLLAPRRLAFHYGDRDRPGPGNHSAAYNDTVDPAVADVRGIYRAFGAESAVELIVSPGLGHEMDNPRLAEFLARP